MQLPLSQQMSNEEIAQAFSFISQVVGIDPKNANRARAYEEAGVVIHQLNHELVAYFARLKKADPKTAATEFAKAVDQLPGIGSSIAAKLVELFTTGQIQSFQKYVKELPAGMYPLMQLYSIGAKKALKLATEFHLDNPANAIPFLLTVAKEGKVRELAGFGAKSEQDLIDVLQQQYHKGRIPVKQARQIAEQVQQALEKSKQVTQVSPLGSLRRGAETVGDVDLGVVAKDVLLLKTAIKEFPFVKKVLVAGDNMIRVILKDNFQVDIKLSPADEWGSFIQHFTGSKEHNIRLRELALKKDLSLSEHGIKIKQTGEMKKFADEKEFYHFLGFHLIPPAERVGGGEFEKYQE